MGNVEELSIPEDSKTARGSVAFGNSQGATMMVPEMTYEQWNEARAEVRAAVSSGMTITAITEAALGPCPAPKTPPVWYFDSLSIRGDVTGNIVMVIASKTQWVLSPQEAEAISAALLTHAKYARRKGM